MQNPLDGSGLVTAIGASIAVIAYLRNVPMKKIEEFIALPAETSADDLKKLAFYRAQQRASSRLILHLISQLGLMVFISLLCYRLHFAIDDSLVTNRQSGFVYDMDSTIGWAAFLLSTFYVLLHLYLDIPEILRTHTKRDEITKRVTDVSAALAAKGSAGR